jgi:hypothetical protein
LLCVDIAPIPAIAAVAHIAWAAHIKLTFEQINSIQVDLSAGVDLLFIDSWHIYGHLRRELAAHHRYVRKYIIMHDTTVDAVHGEVIRMHGLPQVPAIAAQVGYSEHDCSTGLRPAVFEFLSDHPEWVVDRIYENNNGLTILRRRSVSPPSPIQHQPRFPH